MKTKKTTLNGSVNGKRVSSRVFEEKIQEAVSKGARTLHVIANGQQGIGGRIWPRGETVKITVEGPVGQRLGSMGMSGTEITVNGSASDDAGWINCGAIITVLGDVTNGAHNAAAQGKLYVQGSGGARCDTMTKHNPKFDAPESWYFRDVGDTFAEFKAGGIAVVCGVEPRNPENILGYRPCVGMVGGVVYFRGPVTGYSGGDVKLLELTDQDWQWLTKNMKPYLKAIQRSEYYEELTASVKDWKKLVPYTAQERAKKKSMKIPFSQFRTEVWEKEVGKGGIFAEYLTHPLTVLPYITTGIDRRFRPAWNNVKYSPPCEHACPTGIPTQKRAQLIRAGRLHEALELVLQYSPLPASVCGEICPNLCMQACTRGQLDKAYNVKEMGRASLEINAPKPEKKTDKKVAVIGGGPGGLSAAWQLALKGHSIDLYEAEGKLG
ncbi:MAG: NAD(P)-binding protein, partial [Nitrospirota bacterium]|nr:NAD(P)-binding protein [Nitrospirota bacterium]